METRIEYDWIGFASNHGGVASRTSISFIRTLRLPDDGRRYNLPPGLGRFPVRSVSELPSHMVSEEMKRRNGVVIPMWPMEALWIRFTGSRAAVMVAAGKICAVSGRPWRENLCEEPQNFVEVPRQPWLDGFAVSEGNVRQFVAAELGAGATVEEQLTGKAEWGGIQIKVFHPTADALRRDAAPQGQVVCHTRSATRSLGLGIGGVMAQKVYAAANRAANYDAADAARVFVHIMDAAGWKKLTGKEPHRPLTRADFDKYGVPWYQVADAGAPAVSAGGALDAVKSVEAVGGQGFGVVAASPFAGDDLDGKW